MSKVALRVEKVIKAMMWSCEIISICRFKLIIGFSLPQYIISLSLNFHVPMPFIFFVLFAETSKAFTLPSQNAIPL